MDRSCTRIAVQQQAESRKSTVSSCEESRVLRLLYVDDDAFVRSIAKRILERESSIIVTAVANGHEALSVAQSHSFDGVLLDVIMPGMEGPEVFRALRALPRAKETSIVFLTARTQASEVSRLLALGAAGVIPKPFKSDTLVSEVRALFAPAVT